MNGFQGNNIGKRSNKPNFLASPHQDPMNKEPMVVCCLLHTRLNDAICVVVGRTVNLHESINLYTYMT